MGYFQETADLGTRIAEWLESGTEPRLLDDDFEGLS
jgi:hypothetical protein